MQLVGGLRWLAALGLVVGSRAFAATPTFGSGETLGTVSSGYISEASGLGASRQNPGVLWTHNDSAFRGSVFALGTNGNLLAQYTVPGVYSGDFEDMSFGPGPVPGWNYLYLGDIGDNYLARESVRVFRFPEPAVYPFQAGNPPVVDIVDAEEITLYYPDGPFNAEAMFVDPIQGDLYIATKHTNSCRVYQATRAQLDSGSPVSLRFVAAPSFRSVSGADISRDGSLITLRRPGRGGLWVRAAGQGVADALLASSATIPVIGQPTEPNGEAIAFDPDALGYYTLSEGYSQPIYWFPRTSAAPAVPRVFVGPGATWVGNDFGYELPPGWTTNLDDIWFEGPAPFGWGGAQRTSIAAGSTIYLAHNFKVANGVSRLTVRVACEEGTAVYLNGVEIFRRNLAPGAAFDAYAVGAGLPGPHNWFSVPVNSSLLRPGTNVLAAEAHPFAGANQLTFDAQLVESETALSAQLESVSLVQGACVSVVRGAPGLVVPMDQSFDLQSWSPGPSVLLTNGVGAVSSPVTNAAVFLRVHSN